MWKAGARPARPPRATICLVARPEGRPGHDSEHLLLVVDRPAAVGGHRRRGVVGRDRIRVDIAVRDREAEVVADETAASRARVAVSGARVLGYPVDLLLRLVGIPGE